MIKHKVGPIEFFSYQVLTQHEDVSCVTTTREGGLSGGPFATFNLSLSCGDNGETVIDNRAQLSLLTSAFPDLLTFGRQVHGDNLAVVTGDTIGSGAFDKETAIVDTDGMVTNITDVPLVVLIADCVAVSLYDPVNKAVGIVHAGWRGTASRIAAAAVRRMVEEFGSRPADIAAGIGPSIGPCCYQVGSEVAEHFEDDYSGVVITDKPGVVHLDLWKANSLQLRAAGVRDDQIEVARLCTSCHRDVFYSHRREHGRTGRFACLIMLHDKTRRVY